MVGRWVLRVCHPSLTLFLSLLLPLLLPPSTPLSCCFQLLVGVARRRQRKTQRGCLFPPPGGRRRSRSRVGGGCDKQQRIINLASPRPGSRLLGPLIDDGGHSLVNQGAGASLTARRSGELPGASTRPGASPRPRPRADGRTSRRQRGGWRRLVGDAGLLTEASLLVHPGKKSQEARQWRFPSGNAGCVLDQRPPSVFAPRPALMSDNNK